MTAPSVIAAASASPVADVSFTVADGAVTAAAEGGRGEKLREGNGEKAEVSKMESESVESRRALPTRGSGFNGDCSWLSDASRRCSGSVMLGTDMGA